MSIEVYKTLPNPSQLTAWLEKSIRPALSPDVSKYAKGRLRVWLGLEPMLYAPFNTKPGLLLPEGFKERLEELIEWKYDFCLATYSGDEFAVGIAPHMDAGYADFEARSINVSGDAFFHYWQNRETFGKGSQTGGFHLDRDTGVVLKGKEAADPTHSLLLAPGMVTKFNCKDPHAASPGVKRWNLNFWRAKPGGQR